MSISVISRIFTNIRCGLLRCGGGDVVTVGETVTTDATTVGNTELCCCRGWMAMTTTGGMTNATLLVIGWKLLLLLFL